MPNSISAQEEIKADFKAGILYLLAAAFIAYLSIFICGYREGPQVNHSQQWPVFFKLLNPSLYQNDPYVNVLMNTPGIFIKILSKITTEKGFNDSLFIIHILTQFGTISALIFAGWSLRKKHLIAPIIPGLLFCGFTEPLAGGVPIHWNYVTNTSVGAIFALWALSFFLNRLVMFSLIFAAVTIGIQPILGLSTCLVLICFIIADHQTIFKDPKKSILTILPGLILTLYFLFPMFIKIFKPIDAPPYWKDWVLQTFSMHYNPIGFDWINSIRLVAVLILFLHLSWKNTIFRITLYGILIWTVIGMIGAEWMKMGLFIRLQTSRTIALVMPLLLLLITHNFFNLKGVKQEVLLKKIILGGLMLHLLFFNALRPQAGPYLNLYILNFSVLIISLLCTQWILKLGQNPDTKLFFHILKNAYMVIGTAPFLINIAILFMQKLDFIFGWLSFLKFNQPLLFYFYTSIFAVILTALEYQFKFAQQFLQTLDCPKRWTVIFLLYLILILFFQIDSRMMKDQTLLKIPYRTKYSKALQWIKSNTPQDSNFLVYGFEMDFFRSNTQRSLVYDSSIFRALYIDPEFVKHINLLQKRLGLLGIPGKQKISWNHQPLFIFNNRTEEFNADYLILQKNQALEILPVYQDEHVVIYHTEKIEKNL